MAYRGYEYTYFPPTLQVGFVQRVDSWQFRAQAFRAFGFLVCFRDINWFRVPDLRGLGGCPEFEGYGRICKDVLCGYLGLGLSIGRKVGVTKNLCDF